jgi:hypothetical protein
MLDDSSPLKGMCVSTAPLYLLPQMAYPFLARTAAHHGPGMS